MTKFIYFFFKYINQNLYKFIYKENANYLEHLIKVFNIGFIHKVDILQSRIKILVLIRDLDPY